MKKLVYGSLAVCALSSALYANKIFILPCGSIHEKNGDGFHHEEIIASAHRK